MSFTIKKLSQPIHIRFFLALLFPIGAVTLFLNYLHTNFKRLDSSLESVTLIVGDSIEGPPPVLYIMDSMSTMMSFQKSFLFLPQGTDQNMLVANLGVKVKARQLRIYFPEAVSKVEVKQIVLEPTGQTLNLTKLRCSDDLHCDWSKTLVLSSTASNSYLETGWFSYPSDAILLYPVLALIILLVCGCSVLAYKKNAFPGLYRISLSDLSVVLFIFCIFLEQRYFNYALLLSSLFLLPQFSVANLKSTMTNKMNLLFVLLFIVILINAVFVSSHFKSSALEKYMLFLYFPIYLSCMHGREVVKYFPISALVTGLGLVLTSLMDVAIFRNPEIASFTNFARIIDPIYYSYLLAFSFFYIELKVTHWYKYIAELGIIVLLTLCGSKLIISFTLITFVFLFARTKIALVMALVIVSFFVFFKPVQKRFQSIMHPEDLSIVLEDYIASEDDPRINGFTFRILVWQESLKTIHSARDLFLGLGIDDTFQEALTVNLTKRGLIGHNSFNSHNQYISTFCKTGLVGLLVLLGIIVYGIRLALQTHNTLLLLTLLLFSFAMISESVFERQNGVSFFCMIILSVGNAALWRSSTSPSE